MCKVNCFTHTANCPLAIRRDEIEFFPSVAKDEDKSVKWNIRKSYFHVPEMQNNIGGKCTISMQTLIEMRAQSS